jgi:hypothetical protein
MASITRTPMIRSLRRASHRMAALPQESGQPGDRLRSPQAAAFSPSCPFARASERTAQQRPDG